MGKRKAVVDVRIEPQIWYVVYLDSSDIARKAYYDCRFPEEAMHKCMEKPECCEIIAILNQNRQRMIDKAGNIRLEVEVEIK